MDLSTPGAPASAPPRPFAGRLALALAGLMFVLYPAVRPYADEGTPAEARAFASPAWVLAHLAAVAAFLFLLVGLLALGVRLAGTPGGPLARGAAVLMLFGVGLTLPYYGAEMFALAAIGERIDRTGDAGLFDLVAATRMGAAQLTTFAAGLTLVAVAAVLAAIAVRRSGAGARWSGVPLAAGLLLFIPQFYGPPALRIADGVLIAVGCLALARAMGVVPNGRHDGG